MFVNFCGKAMVLHVNNKHAHDFLLKTYCFSLAFLVSEACLAEKAKAGRYF